MSVTLEEQNFLSRVIMSKVPFIPWVISGETPKKQPYLSPSIAAIYFPSLLPPDQCNAAATMCKNRRKVKICSVSLSLHEREEGKGCTQPRRIGSACRLRSYMSAAESREHANLLPRRRSDLIRLGGLDLRGNHFYDICTILTAAKTSGLSDHPSRAFFAQSNRGPFRFDNGGERVKSAERADDEAARHGSRSLPRSPMLPGEGRGMRAFSRLPCKCIVSIMQSVRPSVCPRTSSPALTPPPPPRERSTSPMRFGSL